MRSYWIAAIGALTGCLVILGVVVVAQPRVPQAAPAPGISDTPALASTAVAPSAGTGAGSAGDALLAKDSTEPMFTGFMSSFRSSSIASCRAAIAAKLQTSNPAALRRMEDVCRCATDRVAATITVGEARAASASVFAGDTSTNPTMAALTGRFTDAGKSCMAEQLKLPSAGTPP